MGIEKSFSNNIITNSNGKFFIDIGLNNTAIVYEKHNKYIIYFIKNNKKDILDKHRFYMEEVNKIISKYKDEIDEIYIEDCFINKTELNGIRPVLFAINTWENQAFIINENIKVRLDIKASQIKKAIALNGRANKQYVTVAMQNRLEMDIYKEEKQALEDYLKTTKRKTDIEHILDALALKDTYYILKNRKEIE